MCWSIFNTTYTCTLYLYRECFAETIGEVTKREMKLCWVGGEVSSTMFTESLLCGETEHSELLACEGVCGVTVCMLVRSLTAAVTRVQVTVSMLSALACVCYDLISVHSTLESVVS